MYLIVKELVLAFEHVKFCKCFFGCKTKKKGFYLNQQGDLLKLFLSLRIIFVTVVVDWDLGNEVVLSFSHSWWLSGWTVMPTLDTSSCLCPCLCICLWARPCICLWERLCHACSALWSVDWTVSNLEFLPQLLDKWLAHSNHTGQEAE